MPVLKLGLALESMYFPRMLWAPPTLAIQLRILGITPRLY